MHVSQRSLLNVSAVSLFSRLAELAPSEFISSNMHLVDLLYPTSHRCTALPLVNSPGTSITCTTQADLDARIAATGATDAGNNDSGASSVATATTTKVATTTSAHAVRDSLTVSRLAVDIKSFRVPQAPLPVAEAMLVEVPLGAAMTIPRHH